MGASESERTSQALEARFVTKRTRGVPPDAELARSKAMIRFREFESHSVAESNSPVFDSSTIFSKLSSAAPT